MEEIDFEGSAIKGQEANAGQQSSSASTSQPAQEDVTHMNGGDTEDVTGKDGKPAETTDDKSKEQDSTNPSTGDLNTGDSVEVDGVTYTVDSNGNLVDDKGTIFKEAKDIAEWLKSVSIEDDSKDTPISLDSIQESLGVSITDENGDAIEFTNDADGVKAYVKAVIDLKSNELQEAAINRLYSQNPLLKQFQDYVQINGTPRGFGEIPDRSVIQLDKDNEAQLTAVIKMAAQEFGNKSLNDNYIKYLRDSGGLYDEARTQLAALVEKDENYRKDIETKAAEARAKEAADVEAYWKRVNEAIENRNIGGYRIPDSFTKEVNGQKIVLTTNDFFNYVSRSKEREDGSRATDYQVALNNLTDEEYLQREILDAWLMFTGGTYKDLIDMAVKEDKVRQLKIKSKEQRATKSVKVVRNTSTKTNIDDIIL